MYYIQTKWKFAILGNTLHRFSNPSHSWSYTGLSVLKGFQENKISTYGTFGHRIFSNSFG